MRRTATTSLLATLVLAGGVAHAQDPDPLAVPDAGGEASGSIEAGGPVGASVDDGATRGLGVGALALLGFGGYASPLLGPAVYYDLGRFHLEGTFAFASQGDLTAFGLGARFWYHLHRSSRADFSLGGGLGIVNASVDDGGQTPGAAGDTSAFDLEGGALLRYFLVDNVALSLAVGLVIYAGDADGLDVTGNLAGSGGVAYYF